SKAVYIALGIGVDGHREVLGFKVDDAESKNHWGHFLRDLKKSWINTTRTHYFRFTSRFKAGDSRRVSGHTLAKMHSPFLKKHYECNA
uniref:transposase n=1 Tax=Nosocomiicoccus ampullae TaxID=489910 RepID=UPI0015CF0F74